MTPVVIFGGKGTAINIAEQIEHAHARFAHPMRVVGFAIDDPSLGREIAGFPVVSGVRDAWARYCDSEVQFLFALFRPDVMPERYSLLQDLKIPPSRFANFVHPSAYVSRSVSMGTGNVIMSHACVHHGVTLGSFNIINSNVVVEHDSVLRDAVFVAASACIGARVRIGRCAFLGLGSSIREDVEVADNGFLGMGAVLLRSLGRGVAAYGVPARPKE